MGQVITRFLQEDGQQRGLFGTRNEQLVRRTRTQLRERHMRLLEQLEDQSDQGDDEARGLAKRLRSILHATAVRGHPLTASDHDTIKECIAYLEGPGPQPGDEPEDERDQVEESRRVPRSSSEQVDWLRGGQQAPERRPLRRPAAAQRNPAVSRHLGEGTVPQGADDQLRWLLS